MISTISASELKAEVHHCASGNGELAFLDIREHGQYGHGHPFFAISCPYSRLEPEVLRLVPRRNTPIVIYDDDDDLAVRAVNSLIRIGYDDIRILEGGAQAWAKAGFTLYQGVNVPSKAFGELVEITCNTPAVTALELKEMQMRNENLILLDGRTSEEYTNFSIPGGISCPNAELPLRFDALVDDLETTVVINCAGRTRSIIGAQTLIDFGVPQKIFALENGTQGWALASLELEKGADRFAPKNLSTAVLKATGLRAQELAQRQKIRFVEPSTLLSWLEDKERTTYLIDVRSKAEFEVEHMSGACHVPGGQLVQATDLTIGVLGARIVVCDDNEVRAIMAAHWLKRMGRDVFVLKGGVGPNPSVSGPYHYDLDPSVAVKIPSIPVDDAYSGLSAKDLVAIDLRTSQAYRDGHIPGATWCLRPQLTMFLEKTKGGAILLLADDEHAARLMATDITKAKGLAVSLLAGGMKAWEDAGYPLETSPNTPSDDQRKDYLFFTGQRHLGDKEHMRQYLKWEVGLVGQLDAEERSVFNLPPDEI